MTHHLRGVIASALMAAAPLAVLAQAPAPAPPSARPASSPAPATNIPPAAYPSAFDGYRRFDDQKLQAWRESNDQVGRIGGWRAYARESAVDAAPAPTDHSQHKPAASGQAAPVKALAPAQPASMPHHGHSMHKKP